MIFVFLPLIFLHKIGWDPKRSVVCTKYNILPMPVCPKVPSRVRGPYVFAGTAMVLRLSTSMVYRRIDTRHTRT